MFCDKFQKPGTQIREVKLAEIHVLKINRTEVISGRSALYNSPNQIWLIRYLFNDTESTTDHITIKCG